MCQCLLPTEQSEIAKTCADCGADLTRWMPKRKSPLPQPVYEEQTPASSFPQQAAKFSFYAPLVAIFLGFIIQPQVQGNRMAMVVLGLTSTILIIAGLVFGIVALAAIKRHGREGILGRALVGTCINGLLVLAMLIAIPGLIMTMAKNEARRSQPMQQTQQLSAAELAEEKEAIRQARATVKSFIDALQYPGARMTGFGLRKDFATSAGVDEEFWLQDVSFDGKFFHGTVINKPVAADQIKQGERIAVAPNEVSDWLFVDKQTKKMVGGYSLVIWAKRQPPEVRKAWEKSLGIESFQLEQQ